MLNTLLVRHFLENRFLRLEGVIPPHLVRTARERLEADCREPTDPVKLNFDGSVEKLYVLFARGGPYRDVACDSALLDILASLIGPDIVFTANRHNQGGMNQAQGKMRLHRDVLQPGHITVIAYLDDATPENGATVIVPGSHKLPYYPERGGGMWLDPEGGEYSALCTQAIAVPVHAGGVLIFDSTLVHSVGPNENGKPRAALVFGYQAVNELVPVSEPHQILVRGRHLYRGNISLPGAGG